MPLTSSGLAQALSASSTDKRIDILRRIGEAGSISEAARRAGVSYKAAWQALETLSNLAGTALVEKAVGGGGGGGAVLTASGRRVLAAASRLDQARAEVLAALAAGATDPADGKGRAGLAALALRTSMRNQMPCTVDAIEACMGFGRVALRLPGGERLHAQVTRESVELLELQAGVALLLLCKATAVRVSRPGAGALAGNRLQGWALRVAEDRRVRHELSLTLPDGLHWVGFAEPHAAIEAGDAVEAWVDENALVLARAA